MSSRGAKWAGTLIAIAAAAGLAVYFLVVGLDTADKMASALSAFFGLASLTLAVYAAHTGRAASPPAVDTPVDPPAPTVGATPATAEPLALPPSPPVPKAGPSGVVNEIRGGVFHDTVIQAGYIGGSVNVNTPPPAVPTPPAGGPHDTEPDPDHQAGR